MIGRTLARYRVVEPLGKGGMGVVFRAWDPHLERDVALKLLPEGSLADEAGRARFRREARALSRLNHPAIGTVFDFDTQEDRDFLVMEFVPGTTLAERLAAGPLEEGEVVALGLQIAEALEAAHEQGIVHRDLKPANVMVTPKDRIKVLDFGIAKLRAPESMGAGLTGAHAMLGTLPYMAPEQLLGEEVDARADLFALGAVLYEMAAGRAPFEAGAPAVLLNEVLHRPAVPPRQLRPALSPDLERVILRCLEKDRARRYASAGEVAADLRRLGRAAGDGGRDPRGRIESLAVLPLDNLSRDPEQEFFADGMTESLTSDLARIGAMKVISRTSAMRYKGVRKPLPEIARELGVDAVVEGSVMRVGDRVRITAQLIEAATDRHLWAERYERDVRDVLAIQSEVAQAIAREIQVQLTRGEVAQLQRPRLVDPEAHEAYLKGRYLWNRRTVEALQRALEMFQRAIEKDPLHAPAFSGLADCYALLADNNAIPPAVAFPAAKAAAQRALALDEGLAEAHCSLAVTLVSYQWDWAGGEREYRRAIELDRGYPTAHQWYGILLACLRRFDEAMAHALEAVRRDPLSFILYSAAGDVHYYAGRFEEAVELCRRGMDLAPEYPGLHMDAGRALERSGRHEEAIAEYTEGLRLSGADPRRAPALGCVHAAAGREAEARQVLAALEEHGRKSYVPPYALASILALLGDRDRAVDQLEKAYAARDRAMIYLDVNPRLDGLRDHPRFQELVRKMAFAAGRPGPGPVAV
jgi:TolB-like protein